MFTQNVMEKRISRSRVSDLMAGSCLQFVRPFFETSFRLILVTLWWPTFPCVLSVFSGWALSFVTTFVGSRK